MTKATSRNTNSTDARKLAVAEARADISDTVRFLPQRYVKDVDLRTVKEHPRNANEGDAGALSESVDALGFYGAIIVQEQTPRRAKRMVVVAGHSRRRDLLARGVHHCPALFVTCDDATALKIVLADNRITRLGLDNPAKLLDALDELAETVGLEGTGFDEEDRDDTRLLVRGEIHREEADTERDALNDRQPSPRELPLDLIFTYFRGPEHVLAKSAGWMSGTHSSNNQALKPETWPVKLAFIDNDWKEYDHARHVDVVAKIKPKYATVRDVMTRQQCKDAGIQHLPLDVILGHAEELAKHAEHVIVIPKFDCIAEIPRQYVLGYSVLSSYGATPLATEKFAGRPVHLLGGSWRRQLGYLAALGDDVISIDNNYVSNVARFGRFCFGDGRESQINAMLSDNMSIPRLVAFALSFGLIGRYVFDLTHGKSAVSDSKAGAVKAAPVVPADLETESAR